MLILSVLMFLTVPAISQVTINTLYLGGNPPANIVAIPPASPNCDLMKEARAAADAWEQALYYNAPFTLTLYFGWAPVGDAGTHSLLTQGGSPNRETSGVVLIDNSGAVAITYDLKESRWGEFYRVNGVEWFQDIYTHYEDMGGSFDIQTAGYWYNPYNPVLENKMPLYNLLVHEIGHALGMSIANTSFDYYRSIGSIPITNFNMNWYAGNVLPLAQNIYGYTSHFDLTYNNGAFSGSVMGGVQSGRLHEITEADIIAMCQISYWYYWPW